MVMVRGELMKGGPSFAVRRRGAGIIRVGRVGSELMIGLGDGIVGHVGWE